MGTGLHRFNASLSLPAHRWHAPAHPRVQRPREAAATASKWVVSFAVIFGVLMSAIDTSVVNVALPQIQGNVGATQQEITWISTGYLISVVILMPLTNWLSMRFGRKRVYLVSLALFTVASFMCGFTRTLDGLIFWRVVQGGGAGTLQPLAQAIFREAFPKQEQGMAMGLFGFVVLSGPAIGPTLGGYITDNYSWPWIFFINIPIGIVGYMVASRYLIDPPYMRGGSAVKVDAVGIGLLAVGLAALQTVLEQGQTDDWFSSTFIVVSTMLAVVALIGFVWWELTHKNAAVDLRVFRNVTFSCGTFIIGILGVGLFASLFLLPQYMQILLGFTAMQSGLAIMPRSLAMMAMMPVAGYLYNRLGPRVMVVTGLIIAFFSQVAMSQCTLQTTAEQILAPQVLQGIAFALIFVSLSTIALSGLAKENIQNATGLNSLIRQLGGSFGTAIVVSVLTRHTDLARNTLVGHTATANLLFTQRVNGLTQAFVQHGYSWASGHAAALQSMERLIQQQSAMIGYDYVFFWIGILFAVCVPLVLLLRSTGSVQKEVSAQ